MPSYDRCGILYPILGSVCSAITWDLKEHLLGPLEKAHEGPSS